MFSGDINSLNFQERSSKIQMLENILNMLSHESMVKTPCPTVKNLFYDKKPKNRNNLKQIQPKKMKNKMNGTQLSKRQSYKLPSIQSVITNSINNEFLSSEYQSNKYQPKVNHSLQVYSFHNYPQRFITPNNTNSFINTNGTNINNRRLNGASIIKDNISNNSRLYSMRNTVNGNNILSKINNGINEHESNIEPIEPIVNKKPVDLNDLYKEYIENVSIILIK